MAHAPLRSYLSFQQLGVGGSAHGSLVLAPLWTSVLLCSLLFSCRLAWALGVSLTLTGSFLTQELSPYPLLR